MGTLLHSESRRLYSWWWDSHISPKNSKWLQDNLTDMDFKVKAMIKLIEEDADSFARRAEMYYKKRPELMKLVEEFYRAYRALAERYDHATGELRQAHRTMAQAFPDQMPFVLADDTASSSEAETPKTPHPIRTFFDPDHFQGFSSSTSHGRKKNGACSEESNTRTSRKGLKQLNDMFRSGEVAQEPRSTDDRTTGGQNLHEGAVSEGNSELDLSQLSEENQKLKSQIHHESERACKAETRLQTLRESLVELQAERDALFLQYQHSLGKLSTMEKDLNHAQKDSRGLDGLACEAKTEVEALKEALKKLEAKRDASFLQCRHSMERLAAVEDLVSEAGEEVKRMSNPAVKAETESLNMKQQLARLQAEKESGELLYQQCLEKIADLERKFSLAEERLKMLNEQSQRAESEESSLKENISRLTEERDAASLRYEQCLETISQLQQELTAAQADNGRLKSEVLSGYATLKGAEEQCAELSRMNESLRLEAQDLVQKIAAADQELSKKQADLEKVMVSLQDEHSRFGQVEATLQTLQILHSQSQEEQRNLALELRNRLQMMKDLEICKRDLEAEIFQLKDENQTLNHLNSASSISQKNLQDEMLTLKEIKEKLEAEVRRQAEQSDALKLQVQNSKEEIVSLNRRYQVLMQQVESVGLDPECFGSSVKGLQDENMRLKEISMKENTDREVILKKLQDMEELVKKNSSLESSLLEVNVELQRSMEKAQALQESCHELNGEKSTLVAEKAALLSQLQIITETMQNLLEKNTSLQNLLCSATAELEGLRAQSKGLEELCQLLRDDRSNLVAERSNLVSRLVIVEQKLEKLELRFTDLEDKYTGLEQEKESILSQVEELTVSLGVEKQERASLVMTSEARFSGLEGRIHDLREDNKYRKKEYEELLEKSVNAQVEILILQKYIQDMEEKNYTLLAECQRHVEAGEYSEKLITELESENMIQQLEAEFLLDKIETLRAGINRVLKALEIKQGSGMEPEEDYLPHIVENTENIKSCLSESTDENQQLLIEKSVLSTILGQIYIEGAELSSTKDDLERESLMLTQQVVLLEDEKQELLERTRWLNMEVGEKEKREEALKAEVEKLHIKQGQLHGAYAALEVENLKAYEENRSLREELSQIAEEKHMLEEENSAILVDALAYSYLYEIMKSYGIEKALELTKNFEHMSYLGKAYRDLENEARQLEAKLLVKELENSALSLSIEKLEDKKFELDACNDQLEQELSDKKELVTRKEKQLSEEEQKLESALAMNTELCFTIQCLEKDHEDLEVTKVVLEKQVVELSEHNKCQEKEIACLRQDNGNLVSEVGKLHEEIEEHKMREVILASELHEKSSEFELWEAEAASFYFDLHLSSLREVLFENKVHELGSLCENLEDESNGRIVQIERMKLRICSLEAEAEALKSQLTTCLPLISSLKDKIALLEQNPHLQSKLDAASTAEQQVDWTEESELQICHSRMKVIEDIVEKEKERVAMFQCAKLEEEEPRHSAHEESVSETSQVQSGTEMKDIPLDQASGHSYHGISRRGSAATSDDQMLELWEAAEDCCHDQTDLMIDNEIVYAHSGNIEQTSLDPPTSESHFKNEKELGVDTLEVSRKGMRSNQKGNKTNVFERLASDAKKLMSLQISLEELKRKLEPGSRKKKAENIGNESLRGQLRGLEESVVQLMYMNTELMKTLEESSSTLDGRMEERESDESENIWQKRVSEQAQKEAEKIGRLELEMQTLLNGFLRLKDEKKCKGGRGGISRSSATLMLRDFFYNRERKSKKPKKSRFCGCLRPTSPRK